jgi:GTP1/Obg family GTP-binding protein
LVLCLGVSCSSSKEQIKQREAYIRMLTLRKKTIMEKMKEMKEKHPKASMPPFYYSEIQNINHQLKELEKKK